MKNQKIIIIFFGPPGSGKGTQAKLLSLKIGLPVISPGELLRREQANNTEIGKKISEKMAKGELVPDKIIKQVIDKRLLMADTKNGFMFDGYPRRKSQLGMFKNRFCETTSGRDKIISI
ncbi:adenylate kinase, partial [Candidatus Falkowbacteria bacterium]